MNAARKRRAKEKKQAEAIDPRAGELQAAATKFGPLLQVANQRWLIIAALVLLVLSGGLRFGALAKPAEVVFDEVHFGKFVTSYCCKNDRFFDIHPPHAKLIIAGVGYVFGYHGGFDFVRIGEPFGAVDVPALRVWPAFAGTLLPLVIWLILLQLGARPHTALLGGIMIVMDNALILQSRNILLDSTLLLATFGTICAYFAARKRTGWTGLGFAALCGAAAGLALGTKFTGLAGAVVVGLVGLLDLWRARSSPEAMRNFWKQVAVVVVAAGIIYIGGWWIHFALLTKPGEGDAFLMPTGQFFHDMIAMHKTMVEVNYGLTFTHPDASPWWSWPLMLKPPLYWSGTDSMMILVGNPAVWWPVFFGFLAALTFLWKKVRAGDWTSPVVGGLLLAVAGYAIAYFPLARVPRVLFMYHYFTPMIFTLLATCLWVDKTPYGDQLAAVRPNWLHYAIGGVLLVGFLVVCPLTFGFSVGGNWYLSNALKIIKLR